MEGEKLYTEEEFTKSMQGVFDATIEAVRDKLKSREKYRKSVYTSTINKHLLSGKKEERNQAIILKGELSMIETIRKDLDQLIILS